MGLSSPHEIEITDANAIPDSSASAAVTEIPRVPGPGLTYSQFFHTFLLPNRPCLLGSWATREWPCVSDWVGGAGEPDLAGLQADLHSPATTVPVSNCGQRQHNAHCSTEMSFAEYRQYWEGRHSRPGTALYLKDWHFQRDRRGRPAVYTTPLYFASDWLNEWWDGQPEADNDYRFVYVGPQGTWTPFHSDVFGSYSWSSNIVGKKKWIFYPAGQEIKLKDPLGNLPYDVEAVDERKLDSASKFEIIQNTGETVFVPSGWHHQVYNMVDTISINHNWFNGCNILTVVLLLREELSRVEKELSDCRDGNADWVQTCQQLLKVG